MIIQPHPIWEHPKTPEEFVGYCQHPQIEGPNNMRWLRVIYSERLGHFGGTSTLRDYKLYPSHYLSWDEWNRNSVQDHAFYTKYSIAVKV
jgi:hypothetical protein